MEFRLLGGRYQLKNPISHGGMNTVYRGQDILIDRVVIVKILRDEYSNDPKFRSRFQREAEVTKMIVLQQEQ